MVNNKGESATLNFGTSHDIPANVSPDAIFKALEEQGQDATGMLAEIYDEIRGDSVNKDALAQARSKIGNIAEVINQYRSEIGELSEPIEFDAIGGKFSEDNGVLLADEVKRGEINIGGDPALDLRPLEGNNSTLNFQTLPGVTATRAIVSTPYNPTIPIIKFYTEGITDNPKIIARNFSPTGLKNALNNALTNRKRNVKLQFSNGNTVEVPLEAIRDALQHQGIDTETLLSDRGDLVTPPRQTVTVKNIEPGDGTRAIYEAFGTGTDRVVPGQEIGRASRVRDEANNSYLEFAYAIEQVVDPSNIEGSSTRLANLVKITRNADGKYEVKVARRSENYTGDWSDREVDGVYGSIKEAFFDVNDHIKSEMNLYNDPAIISQVGTMRPAGNQSYREAGVLDANTPSVDVDGVTISKPDSAISRKVFVSVDNRIPNARRGDGVGKVVVVDDLGDSGEETSTLFKNAAGDGYDSVPIYAVSKQSDGTYLVSAPGSLESVITKTTSSKDSALALRSSGILARILSLWRVKINFADLTSLAIGGQRLPRR
jgi:hypothetical protein